MWPLANTPGSDRWITMTPMGPPSARSIGTASRLPRSAGATMSTHLGNGCADTMPRHPNPIWTQLADDRLVAGLIVDGIHLPPDMVKVMVRAKTRERCILVTDAVTCAGQGCSPCGLPGHRLQDILPRIDPPRITGAF